MKRLSVVYQPCWLDVTWCHTMKAAILCFLAPEHVQQLINFANFTLHSPPPSPISRPPSNPKCLLTLPPSCAAISRCIVVAIYVGSLTRVLCSPLDGRPKPCMRMLLEASRAAPQDLPPDMEFFQVPLHLKMARRSAPPPPPWGLPPSLHLPLDQVI